MPAQLLQQCELDLCCRIFSLLRSNCCWQRDTQGCLVSCGCSVSAALCSYLVMHLAQLGSWKVYAVSRKDKLQYDEMPDGLGDTVTCDSCTAVQVRWHGQRCSCTAQAQQLCRPMLDVHDMLHAVNALL